MEQTTFQRRIERKAEQRLLKDMYQWSQKLQEVEQAIGHDFDILYVTEDYNYSNRLEYNIRKGKEIFDRLLPQYITKVTDEILQKVDEIDWLVSERNQENNSDY